MQCFQSCQVCMSVHKEGGVPGYCSLFRVPTLVTPTPLPGYVHTSSLLTMHNWHWAVSILSISYNASIFNCVCVTKGHTEKKYTFHTHFYSTCDNLLHVANLYNTFPHHLCNLTQTSSEICHGLCRKTV